MILQIYHFTLSQTIEDMAKTAKKDEKKLLLRLPKRAYQAVKDAAKEAKRSINSEIEFTLEEKYL